MRILDIMKDRYEKEFKINNNIIYAYPNYTNYIPGIRIGTITKLSTDPAKLFVKWKVPDELPDSWVQAEKCINLT